jgi:sugar lactone lactonase YvrE
MKRVFSLLFFITGFFIQAQIISTVAGDSSQGFSLDNVPAVSSELYFPTCVAFDGSGNYYIADEWNNRIRKVSASGEISTVAGNGVPGFSGDNGPATDAQLNYPTGIALDSSGNIYIADAVNSRIRKVNAFGIISTVVGTDSTGYSGDNGPATNAWLNEPTSVAVDLFGNIYIGDQGNNRVRKVNVSLGNINTIAGTDAAGYSGDGGQATAAQLNGPYGIAVDASGNVYIADGFNNCIREVSASSGIITTVAGNDSAGYSGDGGSATTAKLNGPVGVTVDVSGNIYIADLNNNCIRKVTYPSGPKGIINTIAGDDTAGYSGDNGAGTNAKLYKPCGTGLDVSGTVYIADTYNNRIRKLTRDPSGIAEFGYSPMHVVLYPNPAVSSFVLQIAEADFEIELLQLFDLDGKCLYTQWITSARTVIDVSNLAYGTYNVRITGHSGLANKKLVVIHQAK